MDQNDAPRATPNDPTSGGASGPRPGQPVQPGSPTTGRRLSDETHRSHVIQAAQPMRRSARQYGPVSVQVLTALTAVVCLVIAGLAWGVVGTLNRDVASAGNLSLGGTQQDVKRDGATDILLVGVDSRTDAQGNPLTADEVAMLHAGDDLATVNTDTIILIRVPNDGSSTTAISIPRDSYISTAALGKTKINGVYGQTKANKTEELVNSGDTDKTDIEKQSTQAGRQALIAAVADLTGVTVDHYAEIGLLGFVLLTNAVGGVQVCLNDAVNDSFSGANFPAGVQTLNGSQGLSFVRQRHGLPRGDLDRIARQQAYMASLANNVLSAGVLTNPSMLAKISEAVQRSVVLDSDWDVMSFVTHLSSMAGGNVSFHTIPVENLDGTGQYGESVVEVDPTVVHTWVADLLKKTTETASSETAPTTTTEIPKDYTASEYTVNVYNASTVSGLAGRVSQAITALGFTQGAVSNQQATSSYVATKSTDDHAAQYIAHELGIELKQDDTLAAKTISVVLSNDFSGPGISANSLQAFLQAVQNGDDDPAAAAASAAAEDSAAATTTNVDAANSPTFTASDGPKCVN